MLKIVNESLVSDPPKNIHKIFIPPKILIFLKPHKNNVIQKFKPPQKNALSLRMYQTIRVPRPPPLPPWTVITLWL